MSQNHPDVLKKQNMREKFYKIDLHIHTPASNCYKGDKNDDEYLKIIKRAKKERLKIIAITDHNSIEGYRKILEIEDRLEREKSAFSRIRDSNQSKEEIRKIENKLSLLKDILILPGIEFEVSNCVHFLTIFDNRTSIKEIEKFLGDGGYDEEQFGVEEPTKMSNWDILHLFDELTKFNCIVICAHVDSNKGVYNVIPPSTLRAQCLSSKQLNGIEYKNEVTKDKIANIIRTSKQYQRKIPLAFVKFSDSHNVSEVGRNITYVKLGMIDFESVKNAFGNPTEKISTEYPEIQKILDKLISEEIAFGVEDLSTENKEYFKKLICGLNNSEGGYCLVGLTKNRNKIGLPVPTRNEKEMKNKIKGYFRDIYNCLKEIEGDARLTWNFYPLQNRKMIISVHVRRGDDLVNIKNQGNIYLIKKKKIRVASARELQKMIEAKSVSVIETRIEKKITEMEGGISSIRNFLKAIPIIRKCEDNCVSLRRIIDGPDVMRDIKISKTEIFKINSSKNVYINGFSKGNIVFFEYKFEPRLDYAYLRYSPPIFKARTGVRSVKKELIYLVPGGGVFYSQKKYPIFTNGSSFAIAFSSKEPGKYSNKFISCFLKSSFWLWYCMNKFGTLDIISPDIFQKAIIPRIHIKDRKNMKKIEFVDDNLDKILELEKGFLSIIPKSKKNGEIYRKKTEAHNKKVDRLAYEIDKFIYSLLSLSNPEIKVIESFLSENRIYLPFRSNN